MHGIIYFLGTWNSVSRKAVYENATPWPVGLQRVRRVVLFVS